MKKGNKQGFTLIEVLGIIIVLGIVALITTPIAFNVIEASKEKAYKEIIGNIEHSASLYSVYNELGYNRTYKTIEIETLQNTGYLEAKEIIDPRNNEKIKGCVLYRWKEEQKQYEFKYSETCNAEEANPEVKIIVTNDNNQEWIKEPIKFKIEGEYDTYKYCIGNNCTPNKDYKGETEEEEKGRDIIICAEGYYGSEKGKKTCTKGYNVDDELPQITSSETHTTSRIVVSATCSDSISGVKNIEYSLDGSNWQTSNIFTGLKSKTEDNEEIIYTVKVRCTDNALNETIKEHNVTLKQIIKPTFLETVSYPTDSTWKQYKIVDINYSGVDVIEPEFYFKSTTSSVLFFGDIVEECGTGVSPSECIPVTIPYQYGQSVTDEQATLKANTWYKTKSSRTRIKYKTNSALIALTRDEIGNEISNTHNIVNIDITKPIPVIAKITTTTDTITVTANCTDNESGIAKYEYSLDGGANWSWNEDELTKSQFIFTGLTANKEYKVAVRCTDKVGNISDKATQTKKTIATVAPTITLDPDTTTWEKSRIATIIFNNFSASAEHYFKTSVDAMLYEYEAITEVCGTGTDPDNCESRTLKKGDKIEAGRWYKGNLGHTIVKLLYNNTILTPVDIRAFTKDSANNQGYNNKAVTNIDATPPTAGVTNTLSKTYIDTVTAHATCTDVGSGIDKYEYVLYVNETTGWREINRDKTTASDKTINKLALGTNYKFELKCYDKVGNESETATTTFTTAPKVNDPTTTQTTNSIEVTGNCSSAVGISRYEFSLDGGTSWSWNNSLTSNKFTFTGLNPGTTYNVKVRCTDKEGKSAVSNTKAVKTNAEAKPIVVSKTLASGWKNPYNFQMNCSGGVGSFKYQVGIDYASGHATRSYKNNSNIHWESLQTDNNLNINLSKYGIDENRDQAVEGGLSYSIYGRCVDEAGNEGYSMAFYYHEQRNMSYDYINSWQLTIDMSKYNYRWSSASGNKFFEDEDDNGDLMVRLFYDNIYNVPGRYMDLANCYADNGGYANYTNCKENINNEAVNIPRITTLTTGGNGWDSSIQAYPKGPACDNPCLREFQFAFYS